MKLTASPWIVAIILGLLAGCSDSPEEKLPALLKLRYDDSLDDALDDLGGDPDAIGAMFKGFQRHLYQQAS